MSESVPFLAITLTTLMTKHCSVLYIIKCGEVPEISLFVSRLRNILNVLLCTVSTSVTLLLVHPGKIKFESNRGFQK